MGFKADLEDAAKLVCFQLLYYLVKSIPSRAAAGHLLLVKTDEIGDYILIRHFLGKFRESPAFGDHRITLIGSRVYRDLYEAYDAGAADEVIWLDKIRFRRNMLYRFAILRKVRKAGFSDAVNLVYSRSFRVDDLLVAISGASNSHAMFSTDLPESRLERLLTPPIHYHLSDAGGETEFDACRNARFIGDLLRTRLKPSTSIPVKTESPILPALPADYFVVIPGTGNKYKKWPPDNFAAIMRYMTGEYGLEPVIGGSKADREETGKVIRAYGGKVTDLTGRTSLPELALVLGNAQCLIAVDTGAVHLAAGVGCPVFGLFSGSHYGRFAPYPKDIAAGFFAIYPDEIEEKISQGAFPGKEKIPMHLMRHIGPEKVIDRIKKHFSPRGKTK